MEALERFLEALFLSLSAEEGLSAAVLLAALVVALVVFLRSADRS
jgi:hypothetical protein